MAEVDLGVMVRGSDLMRDRARTMLMSKLCICARTTATIGRHSDEEHQENKPKMPWHKYLRVSVHIIALSLHPHACVLLALCCESTIVCVDPVCVRIAVLLQICATMRF